MTKQYFIELAHYNTWANDRVSNWLQQISDEQWEQQLVSSFNSIQATVLHIISAEHVWQQRLNKMDKTEWLAATYQGNKEAHLGLWKETSAKLKELVEAFDEQQLTERFTFRRINGELNELACYQAFAHLFNHSTYHRGQVLLMLRQVGFTGVSSTDLMLYYTR